MSSPELGCQPYLHRIESRPVSCNIEDVWQILCNTHSERRFMFDWFIVCRGYCK